MKLAHVLATLLLALALAATSPHAHAEDSAAGSLLLFPEFDNRSGQLTLFTVTNTNTDFTFDPNTGLPVGTVEVQFVYVGGATFFCTEVNSSRTLTPGDTFSFQTNVHNPNQQRGFMYAHARHPTVHNSIDFDFLIGSALYIDGINSSVYSTNVLTLEGRTGAGNPTDADGDDNLDLDGIEYAPLRDVILIPRFYGTTQALRSELLLIGLSGGAAFETVVDFFLFNDDEEVFSVQRQFRCWERVPLDSISGFFTNAFLKASNHAINEPLGAAGGRETGWLQIDGNVAFSSEEQIVDPAVYAVLVEKVTRLAGTADLPFGRGTQPNGDLWGTTAAGDGAPFDGE